MYWCQKQQVAILCLEGTVQILRSGVFFVVSDWMKLTEVGWVQKVDGSKGREVINVILWTGVVGKLILAT